MYHSRFGFGLACLFLFRHQSDDATGLFRSNGIWQSDALGIAAAVPITVSIQGEPVVK